MKIHLVDFLLNVNGIIDIFVNSVTIEEWGSSSALFPIEASL